MCICFAIFKTSGKIIRQDSIYYTMARFDLQYGGECFCTTFPPEKGDPYGANTLTSRSRPTAQEISTVRPGSGSLLTP